MEEITNIYDSRIFIQNRKKISGNLKVCAFTRVSTEHEQQVNALENQNQWITDLINQHPEWEFDTEKDLYVDEGISGTSMNKRKSFNEMISKAKAGVYDLIITREVCRFMRNAKITLMLVDELKQRGVEVYFVNDGIWTFNQDDYFKLTIMATYAEQESRKVSERVFSGQAVARANGRHFGTGNILGYDVVKQDKKCPDSKPTTYVINEEQAETVRLIFNMVLAGYGVKKIKLYLQDNGYKTALGKTKWHESTIERILRRRTYIGEYEYMQSYTIDPLTHERVNQKDKSRRIIKKGNFPAIISKETWEEVQKVLDSRINCYTNGSNQIIKRGILTSNDVYCRKMRCGCGRRFRRDECRDGKLITYKCLQVVEDGSIKERQKRSKQLEDNCCINGIVDWKLDLITLRVFDSLSCNVDEVKEKVLNVIDKAFEGSGGNFRKAKNKEELEKRIQKLENDQKNLLDFLMEGVISKDEFKYKKEEIIREIDEKKSLLKECKEINDNVDEKSRVLKEVRNFIKKSCRFPAVGSEVTSVSDRIIETYVNSIKVCADNVFEYNIRIDPNANYDKPLYVPDEEYIPSVHPASKKLDNSNAVLIKEFQITYNEAKKYANSLGRRAKKDSWDKPATIRIYTNV